jgi:iron complex outermembrane receptor protein
VTGASTASPEEFNMRQSNLLTGVLICALAFAFSAAGNAQEALPAIDVGAAPVVVAPPPPPLVADELGHTAEPFSGSYVPASVAHVGDVSSVTKQEIDQTVNVMTSAESIQNLPSTLVRERFIGDRNATVEGRINNPQDSARTMVYADGVLLSNYLGNSYAYPPRWNMVAPVEIERVDVMEGPFSALYGGNSESGVYTITTRMPEHFEFHAEGNSSVQYFHWFEDKETDLAGHMAVAVGDRKENFSYWLIYDRLDAQGHAQTFSQNQFSPTCGTKCLSAFGGVFAPYVAGGSAPNGFPTPGGTLGDIAGSAGADHSEQHFGKIKLAYDVAPAVRLTWQSGFWSLVDNTFVQPYQYTTNGIPLYGLGSGVKINDGPYGSYGLGALDPTHSNVSHLMNSLEFKSDTKGIFDFDLVGTQYNFLRDYTNTYSQYGAVPTAVNTAGVPTAWNVNPTGSNVNQGGNYWRTFDARFIYRPDFDLFGKHIVSFGLSDWLYSLNSVQTNTDVATANYYYDIASINYGKTDTKSAYIQDEWKFLPQWRLTVGARGDWWTAFDGANDSLSNVTKRNPGPLVNYAEAYKGAFSPKGAIEYQVTPDFLIRGSLDRAYRFPTVAEMFQAISTPNTVITNNPNLQPESTTYYDLTAEYHWHNAFDGKVGMITPPGESGEGSWGDGAIEEVVFPSGTLAFYAHGVLAWSSF